jgi:S1-C subfamily serine protease
MNATGLADTDIAGVLGYSLLGRYRIDIDLKRRHMLWADSGVEVKMPSALEVTGGKPIRPGSEVGELDRIASSAREYLPKKTNQDVRGRGLIGIELEDTPEGVRVKSVLPGSPAARAGLQQGDIIARASLGGPAESMENASRLIALASDLAGGDRLFIALKRGGRELKAAVTAERAAL